MEALAILALQEMRREVNSALPDAPVVEDRPSALARMATSVAAAGRRVRTASTAALLRRADLRRAA